MVPLSWYFFSLFFFRSAISLSLIYIQTMCCTAICAAFLLVSLCLSLYLELVSCLSWCCLFTYSVCDSSYYIFVSAVLTRTWHHSMYCICTSAGDSKLVSIACARYLCALGGAKNNDEIFLIDNAIKAKLRLWCFSWMQKWINSTIIRIDTNWIRLSNSQNLLFHAPFMITKWIWLRSIRNFKRLVCGEYYYAWL